MGAGLFEFQYLAQRFTARCQPLGEEDTTRAGALTRIRHVGCQVVWRNLFPIEVECSILLRCNAQKSSKLRDVAPRRRTMQCWNCRFCISSIPKG